MAVAAAMCVVLLGGAVLLRGQAAPAPKGEEQPSPAAGGPSQQRRSESPGRLLGRGKRPVISPREVAWPRRARTNLPEPGSAIGDRRCRMHHDGESGWFVLTFAQGESLPDVKPRFVLPCGWLETMEAELARTAGDVTFRVSGETAVYRRQSYLFLTKVIAETPVEPAPRPTAETLPQEPEPASQPATAPATQPAPQTQRGSPETILERLLEGQRARPLLPPEATAAQPVGAASAAATGDTPAATGGDVVIDRIVYVQREQDGTWWQARFVSDNNLRADPIRLLPCRLLERAEALASASRARGLVARFRVSGEITAYKGRRYLFLRKLIPMRRMGMF
jgi:hypothetical protein